MPAAGVFQGLGVRPGDVVAVSGVGVPVIDAADGPEVTGGPELALGRDLRVASDGARFGDAHAPVGVVPGRALTGRATPMPDGR